MYDADAIEAINFEQLVTVTDRLLLRQGRGPARRSRTTVIVEASMQRPAVDLTVVLSSAIVTTLLFIAALA